MNQPSVQCEVEAQLGLSERIVTILTFGIGKALDLSGKYPLYPKEIDQEKYKSNNDLFLYHSDTSINAGFRIINLKCWEQIVDMLNSVKDFRLVDLEGESKQIELIGDILASDESK